MAEWKSWPGKSASDLPWADVEGGMVDVFLPFESTHRTVRLSDVDWWNMNRAPVRWRATPQPPCA